MLEDIADTFLGDEADAPADGEEEEIPEGDEPEGDEPEGDEPEGEETTDETDEAREPIKPPVSWDSDAKEAFEQLPRELQEIVATREAQRDKAFQQATTEAANAKRNALVEANAVFAEQQRQYASHLEQIASQLAPQRPDPAIAAQDPGAYVQALAIFEARNAQYQQMMQQAAHAKNEAAQRDTLTRNEELAKNNEILANHFGEQWSDTKQRQELLTGLETVGAELGYSHELMGQASAADILALAKASDWKAKAEKWDKLQKDKMEPVRAAKALPRVSKPGTASGRAERTAKGQDAAWVAVQQSRGKNGDAAAAFLEGMGIKL